MALGPREEPPSAKLSQIENLELSRRYDRLPADGAILTTGDQLNRLSKILGVMPSLLHTLRSSPFHKVADKLATLTGS